MKNYLAEFTGTFGFVFIGWGAVLFAKPFIGYLGISMAFGMAYAAVCFAFPDGHFNPAATIASALSGVFGTGGKFRTFLNTIGYILMQIAGAVAAVALVQFIYSGKTGYVHQEPVNSFIVDRYTMSAAFYLELILNFLFASVFLSTYHSKTNKPIACGLFITAAYLFSYPVTKGAINPARTTAAAIFGGKEAVAQLPVFWEAAVAAAILAGLFHNPFVGRLFEKKSK